MTFAHHLQQHHSQSANNFSALDHQQLAQTPVSNLQALPQQNQQQSTDLSNQPQFLHHLLQHQQQTNHNPFQYAQNAIQSADPNNHAFNSQNFQNHSNSLAAHYNAAGSEASNNWSPHSVFIPLASPASSSSSSSNAENNVNRSNKLTNLNNSNGSLKQYDHLTKPTANRFSTLTSSALLQLNSSTGTSPNRSPLSTTNTSSPAQISHNSNTLSPVTFHSSNAAYQLTNFEKQRNLGNSLFSSPSMNGAANHLQTNLSSTNDLINNSRSPISTTATTNSIITPSSTTCSNSTLAKSFTHLTNHPTDPWSHSTNSAIGHQPYLAFHPTHNLSASYHHSTANNSSVDKNENTAYNQYNSLLLAGSGSINNSPLSNVNNQTVVNKQALTTTNPLQHSLTHSTMPNHLGNYNYYHLNSLNQTTPLSSSTSAETSAAISFHHNTANSVNFHYHHYHPNAANYNGYNYGLAMPGKFIDLHYKKFVRRSNNLSFIVWSRSNTVNRMSSSIG